MPRPTNQPRKDRTFYSRDKTMEMLRREVTQLTQMLEKERSTSRAETEKRRLLSQELEETKQELARQKSLKEMFIGREKETKKELELLKKSSTQETLSKHRVALKVRDTSRQKKKDLHVDYEDVVKIERLNTKVQEVTKRNKVLQEELETMRISYQQLNLRYETDLTAAKHEVETLQREQQNQARHDRVLHEKTIRTLRAERDAMCLEMAEEIAVLQQTATETERRYWTELEELKQQLHIQQASTMDPDKPKVAQETSSKMMTAEVQEKAKSKLLQEELGQKKKTNQKLRQKNESELPILKQRAGSQNLDELYMMDLEQFLMEITKTA